MKKITAFLKNSGEKIQDTHPVLQIISFGICVCLIFLIFLSLFFRPDMKRSLFFFPEISTGKVRTEVRYLPKIKNTDAGFDLYVSELLLGPISPVYKSLFNQKARVLRSFIRNSAAYIDLSAEALDVGSNEVSNMEGFIIFKKNVFTNFRNVDKIYMYIDGIEVYSGDIVAGAEQNIKKR